MKVRFLSFEFVSNFGLRASGLIIIFASCFMILASAHVVHADPQPSSSSFQLLDFGFGAGGVATSSSENFMFQGIAGEIESASLSSSNFRIGPGLTYTLEPNTPPAPDFTNPANYYNKLKLVINTGGNSTDTTYAIAVNTASSVTTVAQDSFTEAGTGTANLSTHTAETGGTWEHYWRSGGSSQLLIDKDVDGVVAPGSTSISYISHLPSVSFANGDVYLTHKAGVYYSGQAFRITGTNNAYYVRVTNDLVDYGVQDVRLLRLTAGATTQIASYSLTNLTDATDSRVRILISGSSPTAIKVRVWDASGTEPDVWHIDTTDNTSGNQTTAGSIGIFSAYSSGLGEGGKVDDLSVTSGSESQSSTQYVQADGTLGSTPVWQTYTAWGGASPGTTIIGLTPGATYNAQVAARRGTFLQGAFSPAASAATVNPTLSFSLQTTNQTVPPFTVGIGTVNAGQVTTSWQKVTSTISTNANNGGIIYLNDTSGGLVSATAGNYKIDSVADQNDLSGLLEGYGARGVSVSGAPMELVYPYNGGGNTVGVIDETKRIFADSTNTPVINGSASFELQTKASTTTPAAIDYADIITVVATGSF